MLTFQSKVTAVCITRTSQCWRSQVLSRPFAAWEPANADAPLLQGGQADIKIHLGTSKCWRSPHKIYMKYSITTSCETSRCWRFAEECGNCNCQRSCKIWGIVTAMFVCYIKGVCSGLWYAINHDFQCNNAVIQIMLCFFTFVFQIFCDAVYYVSLHFCPCFFFQLLIINGKMNLYMRTTDVSSVFSSFHMSFSLFSVNSFCCIYFIWDPSLYSYLCTYYGSLLLSLSLLLLLLLSSSLLLSL